MRARVLGCVALALLTLAAPAPAQRRSGGARGGSSHSYSSRSNQASHRPRASGGHTRTYAPRTHAYQAPRTSTRSGAYRAPRAPRSPRAQAYVPGGRDARGRIRRSESARRQFMAQTGYPRGRPGYVVDHVVPLACGGADAPSNMQWQSVAAARAKDRVERRGCGLR